MADLDDQFARLQKQQKQKMERRKKKQDEKNANKKNDTDASTAFGINDDLGLQVRK